MLEETATQEITASLDDAQGKIAPLLDELGIELVINLDDTWSLASDDLDAVATAVVAADDFAREVVRQLEEIDAAHVDGVDASSSSSINDRLQEIWVSLDAEVRTSLSQGAEAALADAEADLGDDARNDEITAQARLRRLFDDKVEFRGLGLNGWAAIRDEILASDRPVLLLVDMDFSKEEGGAASTGASLLRQALDARNPGIFAALLTHTARDEVGEQAVRQEIERTEQVEPGRILVIGKYRLNDDTTMPAAIRIFLSFLWERNCVRLRAERSTQRESAHKHASTRSSRTPSSVRLRLRRRKARSNSTSRFGSSPERNVRRPWKSCATRPLLMISRSCDAARWCVRIWHQPSRAPS